MTTAHLEWNATNGPFRCPECSFPVKLLRVSRVAEVFTLWPHVQEVAARVDLTNPLPVDAKLLLEPTFTDKQSTHYELFCSNEACRWFDIDPDIEIV